MIGLIICSAITTPLAASGLPDERIPMSNFQPIQNLNLFGQANSTTTLELTNMEDDLEAQDVQDHKVEKFIKVDHGENGII